MPTATKQPSGRIFTDVVDRPIAEGKIRELDKVANRSYAVLPDGLVYRLDGGWSRSADRVPAPDRRWITRRVSDVFEDGDVVEGSEYRRATLIGPMEEYRALVDKEARKQAKAAAAAAPKPVNRLAQANLGFRGETPVMLDGTTTPMPADTIFEGDLVRKRTESFLVPGRARVETWTDLVAYARSRQVELLVSPGGGLVPRWPGGLIRNQTLYLVLLAEERGIVAQLTGHRIACTVTPACPRAAITTAANHDPWCLECDGVNVNATEAAA